MSFTQSQVRKLRAKLRPQHIRTRDADGVSLSYVEGWHVVAEANRIFGFDGWDRETVSCECVWTKQVNGRYCAAYVTRIRIRVKAGEAIIVREGSGAGESSAATPGQAHELAAKSAETDATKRALMTFGNAFGLSLYGGATELRTKSSSVKEIPQSDTEAFKREPEIKPEPVLETKDAATPALEPPVQCTPIAAPAPGPDSEAGDVVFQGDGSARTPAWPAIRPLEEAERMSRERSQRIDKSDLTISEPRRLRDLGHLAYVASKPCLICGRNRAHAHHLKFAQPTALGRKVSDEFTVPLCTLHHRELHQHGDEKIWWAAHHIDALEIAQELWLSRRRPASEASKVSEVRAITSAGSGERAPSVPPDGPA